MSKSGLPDTLAALLLMSEADFSLSTVDAAADQLYRAKTDGEKDRLLSRQVELLENGISEADFLKELEK